MHFVEIKILLDTVESYLLPGRTEGAAVCSAITVTRFSCRIFLVNSVCVGTFFIC